MIASLPHQDWQFWVVTACAVGAVLFLTKALWKPLFGLGRGKKANCPGCPNGESDKPSRPKHVDLTIGGKRVRR